MLAAPTRQTNGCRSRRPQPRFVYAVGLLGVTGERAALAASATALPTEAITDRPVLVGVGISNAEQARRCARSPTAWSRARRSSGGWWSPAPTPSARTWPRCGAAIDSRSSRRCELCAAARFTEWFHDDEQCWIAECELCSVPMVVWRVHDPDPPEPIKAQLHAKLLATVAANFEGEVLRRRRPADDP